MSDPGRHLERWREAGLIDAATAERVLAYERETVRAQGAEAEFTRPSALEAVVYLGIIVFAVGVLSLVAQQWDELESAGRVGLVAIPTAAVFLAGLGLRMLGQPGLRRGGEIAWLVAVALFAGLVAVVNEEYGPGADDRGALLFAGAATLALAATLWAISPSHAQVLGVGGAVSFFCVSVGAWPDEYDNRLAGVLMVASGLGLAHVAEAGGVFPRSSSRLAFAVVAALGAYQAQIDVALAPWEFLTFLVGGYLVVTSLVRDSFIYMLVGVTLLFFGLVTFIFEHFQSDIGAPVALIISGAILVAGVLVLALARRAFVASR